VKNVYKTLQPQICTCSQFYNVRNITISNLFIEIVGRPIATLSFTTDCSRVMHN